MSAGRRLTGRYCLLQGSYYGANCAVLGYVSVFLLDRGVTPTVIGALVAVGNILSAICQPWVAGIADRSQRITLRQMIRLTAAAGAFVSLLVGISENRLVMMPLYMLLALITNLQMPLVNAVSVYYGNRGEEINYGVARGLGSLTYAVFSYALGFLTGRLGAALVPWAAFALYGAVFACCGLFQMSAAGKSAETAVTDKETGGTVPEEAKNPLRFFGQYRRFTGVLFGVVMLFSFHNIICTYMIRLVARFGGGSAQMGLALAVAAVCEIPIMFLYSELAKRFSSRALLLASALGFFVKSLLLMAAWNAALLLTAQAFQAFSFALFIPASVAYTDRAMEAGDKVKGQAYMTAALTLGGVVGNLSGGVVLDVSGVTAMLVLGCAFALAGVLAIGYSVRPEGGRPGQKPT